jgi:hypothetical protein
MQRILPSGLVLAVGIWVAWVSYTQTPAEAFLFPRLIATAFVVLALWTFVSEVLGSVNDNEGLSLQLLIGLAPGLAVMLVYVFWAAKTLGFYTATAIAFFILLSLYDPAPHTSPKSWLKRVVITAGFMAVMYALFAKLLNVYTPREILF